MAKLKDKIFNEVLKQSVVHEVLRWYLASKRRGTHSAKTRSEVSGGGIKPWKQKGTGRARAGSIRSPLWRKGGVVFPPKPRDYGYALPKKVRKLGLRMVLSMFNKDDKVRILDNTSAVAAKTKEGVKFFKELGVSGKIAVIVESKESNFSKAVRNIDGVCISELDDMNIHDLMKSQWFLVEKNILAKLNERVS
ncbi:MAG: 50S ribosomal protein L4 [Candidatus Margulisiibacteriota bacterium]